MPYEKEITLLEPAISVSLWSYLPSLAHYTSVADAPTWTRQMCSDSVFRVTQNLSITSVCYNEIGLGFLHSADKSDIYSQATNFALQCGGHVRPRIQPIFADHLRRTIDIAALKRALAGNLGSIRRVSDLARFAKARPETIRKAFSATEIITLSAFLRYARIGKTIQLLTDSQMPIKEICFMVGFSRSDVAAHSFKRITGLTMKEFRIFAQHQM